MTAEAWLIPQGALRCVYLGGPDLPVEDDLRHQPPNERFPLVRWAAEVLDAIAVPHHGPLLEARARRRNLRGCDTKVEKSALAPGAEIGGHKHTPSSLKPSFMPLR